MLEISNPREIESLMLMLELCVVMNGMLRSDVELWNGGLRLVQGC